MSQTGPSNTERQKDRLHGRSLRGVGVAFLSKLRRGVGVDTRIRACEKIEARPNPPLVMAVLDTAIQEKAKRFNRDLDGRVKPGHDNTERFGFFRPAGGGKSDRLVAAALVAFVAFMVGLSFAAVPLYRMFCQATGYAGTPQRAAAGSPRTYPETVTVRFDANTASGLPWVFKPAEPELTLHVGENKLAFFRATNKSNETVTGSAVFNVSPDLMGQYFTKVQCFCFTEQTLKPGETVDMPVSFYIDPAILGDRDAKTVRDMTLSYTFYKVSKPASRSAGNFSQGGTRAKPSTAQNPG